MSTATATTDGGDRRTVVVTGGSGGIGRAIREAFVAEGDMVVALDVDPPPDVEADGQSWSFIGCDVAFLDISEEEWDLVLGVNLKSNFLCGQAARQMVASGRPGAIVNIAAIIGTETGATYSASKGGVAALTKAMALALVKYGIRVNAVAPGSVATPMVRDTMENPAALAQVLSRTVATTRVARRDRGRGDIPGERQSQLHHRADDLRRWWPECIELHRGNG